MAPLDEVGERARGQPVDGAHHLEAGARLVVLVQQLPPEPVHHRQHRGCKQRRITRRTSDFCDIIIQHSGFSKEPWAHVVFLHDVSVSHLNVIPLSGRRRVQ